MVRVISGDAWINEVCALRRAPDGSHISHEPSFTDMGASDIFQMPEDIYSDPMSSMNIS